jgi:hypothetical protein
VILGDGALWIWNLADEHFPEAIQIVDRFPRRGCQALALRGSDQPPASSMSLATTFQVRAVPATPSTLSKSMLRRLPAYWLS